MRKYIIVVAVVYANIAAAQSVGSHVPSGGYPRVCFNKELRAAVRIIDSACDRVNCKPHLLKQLNNVDKPTLLAALRDPDLKPLHVFFKYDGATRGDVLHWNEWKRDQLASLKLIDRMNSVIYVIGQASHTTGSSAYNFDLSQRRMEMITSYLEKDLGIKCRAFRGGWLGYDVFQLTPSDAGVLGISSDDYNNDPLVLNQAVHIFVFPCADLL